MKKILLSLFVLFVGIISFCSAYDFLFTPGGNVCGDLAGCYNPGIVYWNSNFGKTGSIQNFSCNNNRCSIVFSINTSYSRYCRLHYKNDIWYKYGNCNLVDGERVYVGNDGDNSFDTISFNIGGGACPECPTCPTCEPQYTSEQCQSVYGLVSSGLLNTCENNYNNCQSDLNLCQSNTSGFNDQLNNCNLSLNACNSSLTNCLQYNCPEIDYTGDLLRSNIYINNILHPGRQFINIDIPDYITWDYSVGDDDFNLYVGSGYDVDYIESVIDINSYRPTSEDFTNVFVSGLTLVMPYIVIALFIIFVRKLLNRIFK